MMFWKRVPAGSVSTVETTTGERLRLASALVLAEYTSLRDEAMHAMDAAAGAVRWSLATYGVIFASGLIVAHEALTNPHGRAALDLIVLLVFGGVLPGLVCVGAWTWLGEISRLQRAAAQIRSIEARIAAVPDMRLLLGGDPIRQQRYIAEARMSRKARKEAKAGGPAMAYRFAEERFGKQSVQYVSTAGVFFGLLTASVAVFVVFFFTAYGPTQFWPYWWAMAIVAAIAIAFLIVSFVLAAKLTELDDTEPRMELGEKRV
jgi:hypothetical protein